MANNDGDRRSAEPQRNRASLAFGLTAFAAAGLVFVSAAPLSRLGFNPLLIGGIVFAFFFVLAALFEAKGSGGGVVPNRLVVLGAMTAILAVAGYFMFSAVG